MKIKYLFFAIIASVCIVGCKKKETKPVVASTEEVSDSTNKAPDVEMIKDFTMTSVDGKKISLKDEVAKHEITIVDFWASWCGPCKMQLPIVEELSNELGEKAKVGKVNVDEQLELAQQFGIQSIPTLILFKDGKPLEVMVGLQSKETLYEKINGAL